MDYNYDKIKDRDYRRYCGYLGRFRRDTKDMLEMGCGLGYFLQCCYDRGVKAIGLEYSDEGVAACKKKRLAVLKHNLDDPISFFEDESFDGIFSSQVIEHLEKPTQHLMIKEAFRLLRPRGQLVICSPCRHYEAARLMEGHINLLTPSELVKLVQEHGFVDCDTSHNYPQQLPEVPKEIVDLIWHKYQPDLLSQSATVTAIKP